MTAATIQKPGVTIVVEYHEPAVLKADADAVVREIGAMVDRGTQFAAGQTFRLGWSTLRFVDTGEGVLGLEELDGTGIPGEWTRGISRTLIAMRLQRDVVASFKLPASAIAFPSLADSALVCNELDPDGPLYLHRLVPMSPSDSGWFFGCRRSQHELAHTDPQALQKDSLYAHACRVQAALPFLAMPVGTVIMLATDGSIDEARIDARPLTVEPGSYLAMRRGRTSRV